MLKQVLTAAVLLASFSTQAKTATELFESVSSSIVVVYGKNTQGKTESQGSGVVLPTGEIVTNCHVIEKSITFAVKHRSREYPATLKHSDHDRDICSLVTPGLSAPAVTLGSTKSLKVGQKVFAVGAPSGLELTLSEGIVSSLREVKGGRYLQISAPISPGSSGGGLFDDEGRLIGLPTFYLTEGQQLNFAVPVEWIKELPQRQTTGQKSERTSVSWLNKAIELEGKKDWLGLLRHTQAWTKIQSEDANAWYNLGVAYSYSGQTAKALEAFQQALRINPYDVVAWSNIGNVYGAIGQTAKAIEACQQALRINPDHVGAWYNLGVAYSYSGQTAKAIEAYQQVLRINPGHADAWNNLGAAYDATGQTARAIEAFQQALRINPYDAVAWYNLGASYKKSGQNNKITEVYRRLKVLDPQKADEFFTKIVLP